jgi:3-deoxy-D-manno-octulosonic acid kinase
VSAAGGGLLVDDALASMAVSHDWFDVDWLSRWGPTAGVSGGRGAARRVTTPAGPAVLRHYRRGGLVARISDDTYLWRGEDAVRSYAELRVLAAAQAAGLPVPAPLAARYVRHGLIYRADILVAEIAGVETLATRLARSPGDIDWVALGRMIARFHRAGIEHVDLNAHNILIADDGLHVVDFDRARLHATARVDAPWARRVLARLDRSLRKLGAAARVADFAASHASLVAAHDEALSTGASTR